MCTKIQTSHAEEPAEVQLPDVGHRLSPPDDRELALVPVAEGAARPAGQVALDDRGRVLAHLDRDRADAGERCRPPGGERGGVAQDEHLGVARDGAVGLDDHPAHAVERRAEAPEQRARRVARGPDDRLRWGWSTPRRCTEPGRMSVTSVSVRTSTPSRRSLLLGLGAQSSRDTRAGAAARPRAASPWPRRDRCGGSPGAARTAGSRRRRRPSRRRSGPPPTTTKVEVGVAADRVGLALGALEGEQHPAADLERVLQALEPGRERLPFVVAEVGVAGAGGDDEIVVAEPWRRR